MKHLFPVLLQVSHVVFRVRNGMEKHAPLDPPDDRALFIVRKIVMGLQTDEREYPAEHPVQLPGRYSRFLGFHRMELFKDEFELRAHLHDGKHVVHMT
ncbi:MAG: hypothetical protein A4E57_04397 [Syntrophorhabdaceae bacterium PtaU1.Bin034]|nr:MAG: hypothetical protein A4E57_04397 [Syntrophorhabdaceae bacterium PtaU1.Bin034]